MIQQMQTLAQNKRLIGLMAIIQLLIGLSGLCINEGIGNDQSGVKTVMVLLLIGIIGTLLPLVGRLANELRTTYGKDAVPTTKVIVAMLWLFGYILVAVLVIGIVIGLLQAVLGPALQTNLTEAQMNSFFSFITYIVFLILYPIVVCVWLTMMMDDIHVHRALWKTRKFVKKMVVPIIIIGLMGEGLQMFAKWGFGEQPSGTILFIQVILFTVIETIFMLAMISIYQRKTI